MPVIFLMGVELELEEGIKEIAEQIRKTSEWPFLIVTYGQNDSHFIKGLQKELRNFINENDIELITGLTKKEDFEFYKSLDLTKTVIFLHYNQFKLDKLLLDKDPNYLAKQYIGKPINVEIAIYDKKSKQPKPNLDSYGFIFSKP